MAFEDYHNEDPFEFDFDRDPEYGFGHGDYFGDRDDFVPMPKRKSCDRCGTTGLHWENTDNGWRLSDGRGIMHTCFSVNDGLDLLPDLDEEEENEQLPSYEDGAEENTPKLKNATTDVICPYCGEKAKWVSGRTVYPNLPEFATNTFYYCAPCKAHVGCHKGTPRPLGTLANAELRSRRIKTHMAFDPVWQSGDMTRTEAYKWLSEKLGIQPCECHIGMFDLDRCNKTIEVCTNTLTDYFPDKMQ
jgi:hypothetical protein